MTQLQIRWPRVILAAVFGYFVLVTALTLLLGNPIISDVLYTAKAGQSPKVLAVFFTQEPLPALTPVWDDAFDYSNAARKLAVQGWLFIWMLGVAAIFAVIRKSLPGQGWQKGLWFGTGVWLILWLFFEAYAPFNLLGEPFRLVLVELIMELIATLLMGVTVAFIYSPDKERDPTR